VPVVDLDSPGPLTADTFLMQSQHRSSLQTDWRAAMALGREPTPPKSGVPLHFGSRRDSGSALGELEDGALGRAPAWSGIRLPIR
jgi:hypothetical protein